MSRPIAILLMLLVVRTALPLGRALEAGSCATDGPDVTRATASAGPEAKAAPRAVFLVRHAERGPGQDPSLTVAGWERAKALARMLRDAHIDAIYTSEAIRTVQTAEPLATRLGLMIKKDSMADTAALVARVRDEQPGRRVLIVGHSNTVPDAITALGVADPVAIGEQEFDILFIVTPFSDGTASLIRLHYGPDPQE